MKKNDEARRRRTNEIIYRAQAQKTLEDVLFQELVTNFGFEGMKGIARPLIKRVLEIVEEYDANRGFMRPGEVLWLAMDKDRKFGYGLATCLCKMKVVKLQVWTQEEVRRLMKGESIRDVLPDRIARLLKDAYAQGGVLSLVDVGLIVGKSPGCVAEVLRKRYRPRHPEEFLPTIGSVFDVGKTTTHKAIAVKLHLQGLLLAKIARRMDHHPSRVQKYIDDFQRVAGAYGARCGAEPDTLHYRFTTERGQATYRTLRKEQTRSGSIPGLRELGGMQPCHRGRMRHTEQVSL